jgi:hypothetical protein
MPNEVPGKQAQLEKAVELAEKLKKQGARATDIWHDAKLAEVPRFSRVERDPLAGKWSHEVARKPGEPLFSPYASMSENDKIDFLHKEFPALSNDPRAVINVMGNDMLLPGNYRGSPLVTKEGELLASETGAAIRHPALDEYPALQEVDFRFMSDKGTPAPGGSYYPDMNAITINRGSALEPSGTDFAPTSVAIHEMQHAVQQRMGMPTGGSPAGMNIPVEQEGRLRDLAAELRSIGRPETVAIADHLEPNLTLAPYKRYQNILGEQQARTAATRDRLSQGYRDTNIPTENLSMESLDPQVWKAATTVAPQNWSGPGNAAQQLIDMLRRGKILP